MCVKQIGLEVVYIQYANPYLFCGTLLRNLEHVILKVSLFQAIIHPDTGEKILMPFRMSGYVPFGTPMVVGMLLPNQTIFSTIFWQWLNQSHNACVNYSNRNATKVSNFDS